MKKLAEIFCSEFTLRCFEQKEIECRNTYSDEEIYEFLKKERKYNKIKSFATLGLMGGLYYFVDQSFGGGEISVYASVMGSLGAGATMGFASIKRNYYREILGIPYINTDFPPGGRSESKERIYHGSRDEVRSKKWWF